MKNRPFFSIIIPCYNTRPERMRELLESIYKGGCSDTTEVVVSDDRSTDKTFLDIVNEYKDKFYNVIITEVPDKNKDGIELIHCPGNTRQNGVEKANGQWISFIDHDDLYVEGALKKVKEAIEEENEQYFVCSNFYQLDPYNNEKKEEMIHTSNWMHGKFYNLDNFWKKYNLHFRTNLFGNEDICVSAQVNCVWYRLNKDKTDNPSNIPTLWIEDFTYIWRSWDDSTSNLLYEDTNYMEKFFDNYMNATIDTYIEDYNNLVESGNITEYDIEFHRMIHADVILYMYFYLQSFKFNHSNDYDLNIEFTIKKHIKDYYKRFNTTCIDLFNYIEYHEERGKWYCDVWESVKYGVGPFIEVDSFFDFISK